MSPNSPGTSPTRRRRSGRTRRRTFPISGLEWLQRKYELQGETIAALDALAPDAGDPVLRAALRERLERERLLFDTGFTPRLVAGLATPVHLVRYAIEGLTVTPDAAGEALLARLEAAPAAVRQYAGSLRWARDHADRFTGTGIAPVRQLDTLAAQVESWVALDWFGSVPIADGRGCLGAARACGQRPTRSTSRSTSSSLLLRDELRPVATEVDGVGEEVYQDLAAAMLGARVDLAETYAYGWAELERLVAEARALAAGSAARGTIPSGTRHPVSTSIRGTASTGSTRSATGSSSASPRPPTRWSRRSTCRSASGMSSASSRRRRRAWSTTRPVRRTDRRRAGSCGRSRAACRSRRPGRRCRACTTRGCRATTCSSSSRRRIPSCTRGSATSATSTATRRAGRTTPSSSPTSSG